MNTPRFDRDYELAIGIEGKTLIVRPPARIIFSADKSISGMLNKMRFQIFNLREGNRLKIVKDAEEEKYLPVQLKVGYKGKMELIFRGNIHIAKNISDLPDIVTEADCLDGGFDFINSFSSKTINSGNSYIDKLLEDMANTRRGKIAEGEPLIRPKVAVGPTMDLIRSGLGKDEYAFIDDETLNVVRNQNQVIDQVVPVVNSRTGLLNTPERDKQKVTFETMMNPELKIGRRVKLESKFAPHLNGIYRVETINYSGDNEGERWGQIVSGYLAPEYQEI